MELFVLGAIGMGFWVAGLFFLRFWRETRDRLFLIFALAFWLLALGRVFLAATGESAEGRTYIYLVRLGAFLLIIAAIVDKNRSAGRSKREAKGAEYPGTP